MNTLQEIKKLEKKIETLKQSLNSEWVKPDIPQRILKKYGIKPFKIMKRRMRKDGKVWNNINYFDAKKEAKKLGYRLPNIREMLALLEYYLEKNKKVSIHDKEFLGIEELSYDEDVYLEWIDAGKAAAVRGGNWGNGANAGVFTLSLANAPSSVGALIGFRCAK